MTSQASTGNRSDQRLNGVHAISEVSPIRMISGNAQKAAMRNPQIQTVTARPVPLFHNSTGIEAMMTTRVVSTWQRAVAASAAAAQGRNSSIVLDRPDEQAQVDQREGERPRVGKLTGQRGGDVAPIDGVALHEYEGTAGRRGHSRRRSG